MSHDLDELATRHGLVLSYYGLDGSEHWVPDQTKRAVLRAMGIPSETDEEIAESLRNAPPHQERHLRAVEGARCYMPDWLADGRCWGIAVQVYSLRSERNWGIGDFADLAAFAETAAASGADFLGTNPLHAGFLAEPNRRSPFFPSNRRFLNPLYIAVDQLPGFERSMGSADEIAEARQESFVDYPWVSALKLAALRKLWPIWKETSDLPEEYAHAAFAAFKAEQGEALRRHALFETLSLHLTQEGKASGWETWPEDYHSPETPSVAAFAAEHEDDIEFHGWLQFLAGVQLTTAQSACRAAGMRIGLYLDFAVGEAPDGSATWSDPGLTMRNVQVGAPPDYFATNGQDWGLAPISPTGLLARDLEPYKAMMTASMRYAGALRIDHAMAIWQLFLVPRDTSPLEGTYLRFPIDRMLQTLSETSNACHAVVIGEDLGNVPDGFREVMAQSAMLSYRILYFEREDWGFRPPHEYPREGLACLSTHDLPTLEGWWRADDAALRQAHDLIDATAAAEQAAHRATEREQLLGYLRDLDLLSDHEADAARHAAGNHDNKLPPALAAATHRFVARTPSHLMAARIEDLLGENQPVNLPGTVDSYPNWKRKLPIGIEEIGAQPLFRQVTSALCLERPRNA